jgi:NAD(P)-dependent dehydrogenase (short-subunit alcohol dehydrogenase family)
MHDFEAHEFQQTGTFFAAQLAVRQMVSQQRQESDRALGSVVMVASASASGSCPGHMLTAYGGSKGFVKSFALQLAHEMAATGIRVNSISPG